MSHRIERNAKDCLNCGTIVQGRYCQACGQQNLEPKETFRDLFTHFIYDLTHFDGNFFSTLKHLLLKPGFLPLEYIKGRRARYINPIRMYIFISAVFFLFFFSAVKPTDNDFIKINDSNLTAEKVKGKIQKKQQKLTEYLTDPQTTPLLARTINEQINLLQKDTERLKTDNANLKDLNYYKLDAIDLSPEKFTSAKEYDSIQASLPQNEKAGWFKRRVELKKMDLVTKYGRDMRVIFNKMLEKFLHTFPQILFVSLPLFALLLQLLYIRKRKIYYYADHIIYTVHLYCAMFLFIFVQICLSKHEHVPYAGWLSYLGIPLVFYILWYIYESLRKFYQQSHVKTFFKFLLLMFISFFLMSILVSMFFVFSAFTI